MASVASKKRPLVSVVVPSYNREEELNLCLRSVDEQTYGRIEKIVVDNFSSDSSLRVAKQHHAKVYSARTTASQARNLGLERSKGKYVMFLDSDVELMPDVIRECVDNSERFGLDAIHVPALVVGRNFWVRCVSLEKLMFVGDGDVIVPIFFRKEVLDRIGGMDDGLEAGEDWDLWTRLKAQGARSMFISSFQKHYEFASLAEYVRKKYRWSRTIGRYVSKYRVYSLQRAIPITPSRIWRSRELVKRHPLEFGGLFLMFIVKVLVGLCGVLMTSFGRVQSDSTRIRQMSEVFCRESKSRA